MSKYVIEYEDTPSSREDGVNYYKCKNSPYHSHSEQFISKLTPYEKDEAFMDGMAQMFDDISSGIVDILAEKRYSTCVDIISRYSRSHKAPQAGDVVEYHDRRYLVVNIDEEFYYLLNGRSFEVVCVDKSLRNEIVKMNDRKDLNLLAKALKGET